MIGIVVFVKIHAKLVLREENLFREKENIELKFAWSRDFYNNKNSHLSLLREPNTLDSACIVDKS